MKLCEFGGGMIIQEQIGQIRLIMFSGSEKDRSYFETLISSLIRVSGSVRQI